MVLVRSASLEVEGVLLSHGSVTALPLELVTVMVLVSGSHVGAVAIELVKLLELRVESV